MTLIGKQTGDASWGGFATAYAHFTDIKPTSETLFIVCRMVALIHLEEGRTTIKRILQSTPQIMQATSMAMKREYTSLLLDVS